MVIYVTIVTCIWNIIKKIQYYHDNKTQYVKNSLHGFSEYVVNAQSNDNDLTVYLIIKKC